MDDRLPTEEWRDPHRATLVRSAKLSEGYHPVLLNFSEASSAATTHLSRQGDVALTLTRILTPTDSSTPTPTATNMPITTPMYTPKRTLPTAGPTRSDTPTPPPNIPVPEPTNTLVRSRLTPLYSDFCFSAACSRPAPGSPTGLAESDNYRAGKEQSKP